MRSPEGSNCEALMISGGIVGGAGEAVASVGARTVGKRGREEAGTVGAAREATGLQEPAINSERMERKSSFEICIGGSGPSSARIGIDAI